MNDLQFAKTLIRLEDRCKSKGWEFNLNLTSIRNLYRAKKCYFTGTLLTSKNRTIDRIDNTKGYIKGNVVACDKKFNMKKGSLTLKEIIILYRRAVLRRKRG
jgi:hypothetical protein